ncbi:DUF3290 family protein [Limosilactobacillus sp. Sa3CUN2]|uniref:DUF3290 family protein n=1 Tax=Limosilactobacillus avistercoris TaxID=2762243 RepID=A0ABR8PAN6_9LACO|nr:DUF3290 family protein [Limosilactobacillus avistercoris]MBD7894307.1 DUF3290 family protein [Limosilactobacillus avistercoris]
MTFYTEDYFLHQQQFNSVINYAVILVLIILVLINSFRYLHHQLQTRYRDLGIIFFLLLLIFAGLQITNLEKSYSQQSQSLQMRPFIRAVARDHNISSDKVVVNSTTLTDGIIVRFNKKDYRVNLSPNGDNYTLTRAHVVDHRVIIEK